MSNGHASMRHGLGGHQKSGKEGCGLSQSKLAELIVTLFRPLRLQWLLIGARGFVCLGCAVSTSSSQGAGKHGVQWYAAWTQHSLCWNLCDCIQAMMLLLRVPWLGWLALQAMLPKPRALCSGGTVQLGTGSIFVQEQRCEKALL